MTSTSGQRMLAYLPRIYEQSRVVQTLLESQGAELDGIWAGVKDILDQMFVQTATWGLPLWEEEFGFSPTETLTDEERRSRVLGRQRGYGTVTLSLIHQIAESYQNGRVSVTPDYPASTMIIRFVDTAGTPPNLSDLQAELRRVLPAKYAIQFEFRYLTWDELDAKGLTWDELDALNLTWDQWDVWQVGAPLVGESLTLTGSEQ